MTLLEHAEEPVGSGAVCDWLRQNGVPTSEATAGRFLRELDHKGYTTRIGFRGRHLAQPGQARLTELRRERASAASSTELMNAIRPKDTDDLVDVLVARRALEREISRLAALQAVQKDLDALEILVVRYESTESPEAAAEADFSIHERLAEVAGNKVLQAATRLIHEEAQAVPIPDQVRHRLKPVLARQHREILEALRSKDPDQAEAAMVAHLDGLIEAVQRYGKQHR